MAHLKAAEKVLTHPKSPIEWAALQNQMGVVHEHFVGNRNGHIKAAIRCHRKALQVQERHSDGRAHAYTLNYLGRTHRALGGNPIKVREAALPWFEAALKVLPPGLPADHASITATIASLHRELADLRSRKG